MPNQEGETGSIGQNLRDLHPKTDSEKGADDASDGGSFLDDGTEDFLPSEWIGGEKKSKLSDYKPRKRGAMKVKSEMASQSAKMPAIAKRPTPKQEPQPAAPKLCSLEAKVSSLVITSDDSSLVESPAVKSSISSTTSTIDSLRSTVTIGRLQVPASLVRQPRSAVELMQEQIKSLKRDVERKEKDVKYANQQVKCANQQVKINQMARSKAEDQVKEIRTQLEAKIESLQNELGEAVSMIELRNERNHIQGQLQKATADLMKLREKHDKVVKRFSAAGKKLITANGDLAMANVEIEWLKTKKSEQHHTIENLSREATSARISHQRLQEDLLQERADGIILQNKNDDLSAQFSTLSERLLAVTASPRISTETQNAIHRYRSLQGMYDKLKRDYNLALRDNKNIEEDRDSHVIENIQLRRERDNSKSKVKRLENDKKRLISTNRRLEEEKEELEEERELLDPIIQIGVDVRLRNLEWARETALGVPTSDIDRAIIRKGNIAAHRANATVDAALFEADLVPEEYVEEASHVFQDIYGVTPSNIGHWEPQALRLTDCQATLRTHKAVRKSVNSAALRKEYDKLEDILIDDYNSMLGYFETDPSVDHRLLRLEEVTEEIVDIERGKGGRRKTSRFIGNSGATYDSDDDDD
ncbi:hypothetical protein BKA64DRAFT_718341 [Cadophora sp. MPI-SDFR-AT-0126]|nr:hypothetical protein BKA64DRAFT_718341 [Leotiomycetes sp. MPI-SDFR-AT-0126]